MNKGWIALPLMLGLGTALWWWRQPQPLPVALLSVQRGAVESLVANTRAGTLKACRRSHLSFNQGGRVEQRLVNEGQRVAAGEVLLRLRQVELQARVEEAQARGRGLANQRQQRCLQAELEQRDHRRLASLQARQLVAEDRVDQSATRARLAALACTRAASALEEAEANLALQHALLDQTTLRAPFAGIVAEINGEVGEFVTPSPPGIPTPPAVDLIDDSCLYVEAPIDEVDAAQVQPGMPVRITLDAFRGQHFSGQVQRVAPFVRDLERQARTADVEVRFEPLPDQLTLLTGYSADVEVLLQQRPDALRIPTESLLEGERVLRYDPLAGVLREVSLRLGLANWRWTEVLEGLSEGDRILASLEQEGLADGVAVRPEGEGEP
jgi:HlyD family secretion protein